MSDGAIIASLPFEQTTSARDMFISHVISLGFLLFFFKRKVYVYALMDNTVFVSLI